MTVSHWDAVYGRPSISKDAVLLGVAAALHLPLLLLQFKAPLKMEKKSDPLYVIQMREEAIARVLAQGVRLPTSGPGRPQPKVDLSNIARLRPAIPAPSVSATNLSQLSNPGASTGLKLGGSPAGPKIATVPDLVGLAGGPGTGQPLVSDKGAFRVAPNTIQSLAAGPGKISGAPGSAQTIQVPTGPTASAETGLGGGGIKTSKILAPAVANLQPVGMGAPVLKDKGERAGKILAPAPIDLGPDENVPVAPAQPRDLTPEQRQKELFPIRGALRGRQVIYSEQPEVPEWFRKKGIEATVRLGFSVTPDGRVKENINTLVGSGFSELDRLARNALAKWRFEELDPAKGNEVQDGMIEFKFSIK